MNEVAAQEGILAQELGNRALETYLFLRQFRSLSERMIAKAEARGICTDEDVFDQIGWLSSAESAFDFWNDPEEDVYNNWLNAHAQTMKA